MAPTLATVSCVNCADGSSSVAATQVTHDLGRDLSDGSSPSDRRVSSSSSGSSRRSSEGDCKNSTNIYVSELPPALTEDKFQELFAPFGVIISARLAPRRKGFLPVGFVQYTTPEAAKAAIAALDHKRVLGARISVRIARRDKDKGISSRPSITLYVANMPLNFTETDLRTLFSHYGTVRSTLVFRHADSGVSKGTALVRFVNLGSAMAAKEALHCSQISGHERPLEVKYAESRHDKELRLEMQPAPQPESRSAATGSPSVEFDRVRIILTEEPDALHANPPQPTASISNDALAMRVLNNCLQFLASFHPSPELPLSSTAPSDLLMLAPHVLPLMAKEGN